MKSFFLKHVSLLMLGLGAMFAGVFSLCIGLQQSVWFDEAYSILLAEHSWVEIVRLTAQDVHPPMYYWILKAWMSLFGSSELALRSMSALFLGLSIFVAGLLLRRLFGTKAAVVALPFLVLAPFLLRYGFEIRMYSLASFIGISSTYVLVLAVEEMKRNKRWLLFSAYALLVAVGVYTLYFLALLFIAHLVWIAWIAYERRRLGTLAVGICAYFFAFLLFIPWLPVFLGITGGDSLSPVTHQLGFNNLYGIMTFLYLYQPPWEVMNTGIFIANSIVVMVGYLSYRAFKNVDEKERSYLLLLAMSFVVPILTLVVVTYFKPIYIERYVAHVAIGFYAFLGAAAALAMRKTDNLAYAATGGLAVVVLFGCFHLMGTGNYNFQRLHKPLVNDAAALMSECNDGAIVFADGPQVAMELMYYIDDCPVYFFNETYEMGGGFAMLSESPMRVADVSELPKTEKMYHIFYDEPKKTIPRSFSLQDMAKFDTLSVATYRASEK